MSMKEPKTFEVDGETFTLKAEGEITGGEIDELIEVGYLKADGNVDFSKQREWNAAVLATCFKGMTKEKATEIPFKVRNDMLDAAREILGFNRAAKEGKDENFP
jgi:hypothetical protein